MGVIYLARMEGAAGFVKPVVIKRMLPDLDGFRAMVDLFAREARIMANLRHPNIVGIVDFAEEEGAYLMVLDYVHGYHLGRWQRFVRSERRLFPADLAIHIVVNVLDALQYAYSLAGPDGRPLHIIHRDISPGNVLIDVEGLVKLTDFGIARMRTDHTEASQDGSSGSAFKGKLAYSAPELLRLEEPSHRSDIYSCGVLLHELLVGKNEFAMGGMAATVARVLNHELTPVDKIRSDVAPEVTDVLRKVTAKSPGERFRTALEFAQELRALLGVSADEAGFLLHQAASGDFNNPAMAKSLGVAELGTLERSWREAEKWSSHPPGRVSVRPLSNSSRAVATMPFSEYAEIVTRPPAPDIQRRAWIIGGAVGGIALITGVTSLVLVLTRQKADPPDPGVILVEGSVDPEGIRLRAIPPADSATAAPSASTAADGLEAQPPTTGVPSAMSSVPPTSESASGPHPASSGAAKPKPELLASTFAQKDRQIAQCFSQYASDVSGSPQISVRFEVATDGHVSSAQLQPGSLGATPLGGCILSVAKATQFGPQSEPVTFRIPITAHRGK